MVIRAEMSVLRHPTASTNLDIERNGTADRKVQDMSFLLHRGSTLEATSQRNIQRRGQRERIEFVPESSPRAIDSRYVGQPESDPFTIRRCSSQLLAQGVFETV